jgi:ADP-ribose pyrophosphatase
MTEFEDDDYQIVESKRVFQGYFAVEQLTLKHRLFNGQWSRVFQREIFERGSAAAVLLFDPDLQEVVMLEQFRVGALASQSSPWMIEVVAGIIEEGESAEEVAIREATEEAGKSISDLIKIGQYFMTPGGSSEQVTLYCARVDAQNSEGIYGLTDENEDIRVFTMTIDEVKKAFDDSVFENATTVIALQWLLLNYENVHKLWNN